MEFWIKQDGAGAIQLPVKPSEFNVTVAHRNTVVNVIQMGDINLMGKSGLREIPLSSFFPAKPYNFSNNRESLSPISYVEKIEGWRTSGKPIRVIITDLLNMEATIESFTWGEKDGTGDIYYTLMLKEYRRIKTRRATVSVATATPSVRKAKAPSPPPSRTYTVKGGDCLWTIAKRYYGNGSKYTTIVSANQNIFSKRSPNLIYAGDVLVIP